MCFYPRKGADTMDTSKEELSMFMNSIIDQIRKNATMSQTAFDLWFSDLHLLQIDTEKIVLATGDELKRKFLVGKCTDLIAKSVHDALGYDPSIEIICDAVRERNICIPTDRMVMGQEISSKETEGEDGEDASTEEEASLSEYELPTQGLCPEYTFETHCRLLQFNLPMPAVLPYPTTPADSTITIPCLSTAPAVWARPT